MKYNFNANQTRFSIILPLVIQYCKTLQYLQVIKFLPVSTILFLVHDPNPININILLIV